MVVNSSKRSTKKNRLISVILAVFLLAIIITPVFAQDYSFSVQKETVDVFINADGSATIEYAYLFKNEPGAHVIDYVDVGVPNGNYSLSDISATVNGKPITDIQDSPYVTPGIALGLGSNSILAGQSGTITVQILNLPKMLFFASTKESEPYASFNFQPNYFDSKYVVGATEMVVNLHLPPGLISTEPRYFKPTNWPGNADPATALDSENRIIYQSTATNANSSSKYSFGASFPTRLVPNNTISSQQSVTFIASDLISTLAPYLCCGGFTGLFVLVILFIIRSNSKRKLDYLPPKIAVEGHGIKRGLTAVEAAILMEQPMDKVLTMILFGLLKKEAVTVVTRDPLEIKPEDKLPEGLNPYEISFMDAYKKRDPKDRRTSLQGVMVSLVQGVSEKMKGFSRKETLDYYQSIIKQAWEQVEAGKTPEVKSNKYGENMEWTMLDKEYGDRTQRTFGNGPIFMPFWWWRADPTISHPATSAGHIGGALSIPTGGKSTTFSLPNLPGSTAAATVVGTVQGFSSKIVGDINSFTSGVTNKTNPLPQATSSGWKPSGGSGGGTHCVCACACACAGCACACAGGGR